MRKQLFSLLAVFVLALVVFTGGVVHAGAGALDRVSVDPIRSCLPPTPSHFPGRYRFELVGYVESPSGPYQSFYLLDVHRPWEQVDYPWETLIGVRRSGGCFNFLGQDASNVTLTAYAPKELAKALALQHLSYWFSVDRSMAERRIRRMLYVERYSPDDPTSSEPTVLAPEYAWALQSLGYQIPPEVFILPELTPYYER